MVHSMTRPKFSKSPDGISKSFDASADGYARGEGIVALHVKLLSDALRDGDPIRGVIRSTTANSDGKTPGLTVASAAAHEAVIRKACSAAGIEDFTQTGFVELHATGTSVSDPIEATAASRVFGSNKGVYIGSLKPNIGHLEGASGLSAVIKSLLALEKRIIPPNIHFRVPNPKIPFKEGNMVVPTRPVKWPANKQERASINSFSIGGSNAHVILEPARLHGVNPISRPESQITGSSSSSEMVWGSHHEVK